MPKSGLAVILLHLCSSHCAALVAPRSQQFPAAALPAIAKPPESDCRKCKDAMRILNEEAEKDFPSRPPPERWAERLRASADAARADPCQARLILVSYDRKAGFASRINTVANEMLYGLYDNYSMAFCASSADSFGGFYEKVMRRHFQSAAGLPVCVSNRSYCGESEIGYTHYPGEKLSNRLAKQHADYLVALKRFILSSLLTYSEETLSQIERRLKRVGIGKGSSEPYIAVHIRRGDKWAERFDLLSTAVYAEEVAKLRNSSDSAARAQTLFLATDDRTVPQELQDLLGPSIRVVHQDWSEGMLDRVYNDDEEVLQLLTDLEGLRRASHFIGTVSSNIGRLVYLLRGQELPSVTVDGNGNWLDREAARKNTVRSQTPVYKRTR